jgi:hypothetical protein
LITAPSAHAKKFHVQRLMILALVGGFPITLTIKLYFRVLHCPTPSAFMSQNQKPMKLRKGVSAPTAAVPGEIVKSIPMNYLLPTIENYWYPFLVAH